MESRSDDRKYCLWLILIYILYRSHGICAFLEISSAEYCVCSMWLCFWILCEFYYFLSPVGNSLTNLFRFKVITTNNSTLVALSFTSKFNTSVFENILCIITVIWIFNDEPASWLSTRIFFLQWWSCPTIFSGLRFFRRLCCHLLGLLCLQLMM